MKIIIDVGHTSQGEGEREREKASKGAWEIADAFVLRQKRGITLLAATLETGDESSQDGTLVFIM